LQLAKYRDGWYLDADTDARPSIDLLAVQQSKEFATLNAISQEHINELVKQGKIQEQNHIILDGRLHGIQQDIQLRFSETGRLRMREGLLESPFFPEIDQRRSEITEPASHTLDWLFEATPDVDSNHVAVGDKDEDRPAWPDFRHWLREESSTYWISGKAGSGKSTLMAHIVNDKRTNEALKAWTNGHAHHILSFFFWRAGSQVQKSVPGLLRSLLYQMCKSQSSIADTLLSRIQSPAGIIPTWTTQTLLDCATKAIKSAGSVHFCIFIDGLDEYTGDYDHLVDCIGRFQDLGNVKVCVSSRPETQLVHRLRELKHLRLQDLNGDDIFNFVDQSLAKTQLSEHYRTELAGEVGRRAEGVFLWASLVTQSLVKGYRAGDDEEILWKRLDSLPSDMNQLFEQMLANVDDVHKASLVYYLQLMKLSADYPEGS
jgi:hypothetical protein